MALDPGAGGGAGGSGGGGRLSAATKAKIRALILEKRLGNKAICQELEKSGVRVTESAICYYRRDLLPEIQSSDLEAIQAGAASFVSRAADLSAARAALIGEAVIQSQNEAGEIVCKLSTRKDAGFLLMVASKIEEQLQRLTQGAEDRIYKREKTEQAAALVAVEKGRLKIEQERAAREAERDKRDAEKHALEMRMTLRELEELEREDDAQKQGDGNGE